jgi:hypothetical protein
MADLSGVKVGDVLRLRHWLGASVRSPITVEVSRLTPKFAVTASGERFRISDGKGFGYPAFDFIAEREATNDNA